MTEVTVRMCGLQLEVGSNGWLAYCQNDRIYGAIAGDSSLKVLTDKILAVATF